MSSRRSEKFGIRRLEHHPRGHIASCNGRLELVKTRIIPCPIKDDVIDIREEEAKVEEMKRKKQERLVQFQRDVKERVRRKERERSRQLVTQTRHTTPLKRGRETECPELNKPCDDVFVRQSKQTSTVQQARLNLLSVSRPSVHPPPIPLHTEDKEKSKKTRYVAGSPPPVQERLIRKRHYIVPERQTMDRQREQAQQLHQFHRLYSQLEREHVRQARARQTLLGEASRRKRENELLRRMAEEQEEEEEEEEEGGVVSIGSWEEEEEEIERLEEWHQTLALEKRRHQLQVAKETERYVEALRAQLRERLASTPSPLPPPLCLCGTTLWDTDPQTCANNCPFYQNPKAYARALSKLLRCL